MTDNIATADGDGAQVERIADRSQGPPTLYDGIRRGVRRLLREGPHRALSATRLFNDQDMAKIGQSIAHHNATAEIAGRARIRQRTKPFASFAEPTALFARGPSEVVEPKAAVDWFRGIAPASRVHPAEFEARHDGSAFQLAATTDAKILEKVHEEIARRLLNGDPVNDGAKCIREILAKAGIGTTEAYPRMVYRTNLMEAYRNGSWDEFSDPDLEEYFPVWEYMGIADGRERQGPYPKPDHHQHFGKYFPRHVSFFDVRGREGKDVCNCRCDMLPINKLDWRRLQRQGAVLSTR